MRVVASGEFQETCKRFEIARDRQIQREALKTSAEMQRSSFTFFSQQVKLAHSI